MACPVSYEYLVENQYTIRDLQLFLGRLSGKAAID
jgi:hypothetical protein